MDADQGSSAAVLLGRVRWKRLAVLLVPAAVIAFALIGLTKEGAIASNLSVSGQEFTVTSTQLTGTGFEQFGSQVAGPSGSTQPVVVSGIRSATLSNLCQSVSAGPVTIRLTAGGSGTPVSADNLVVDASQLNGSTATFHNISIGQDAGTLTQVPGTAGTSGAFGEQASDITIHNLVQHTWMTTAGTFTLPDLSIGFGGSC